TEVYAFPRESFVTIDKQFRLVVRGLPDDATIEFARFCGHRITFDGSTRLSEFVRISPRAAKAALDVTLGVKLRDADENHSLVRISRRLKADLEGVVQVDTNGRSSITPDSILTTLACHEKQFRVFVSGSPSNAKMALMEGPRLIRWLGH